VDGDKKGVDWLQELAWGALVSHLTNSETPRHASSGPRSFIGNEWLCADRVHNSMSVPYQLTLRLQVWQQTAYIITTIPSSGSLVSCGMKHAFCFNLTQCCHNTTRGEGTRQEPRPHHHQVNCSSTATKSHWTSKFEDSGQLRLHADFVSFIPNPPAIPAVLSCSIISCPQILNHSDPSQRFHCHHIMSLFRHYNWQTAIDGLTIAKLTVSVSESSVDLYLGPMLPQSIHYAEPRIRAEQ